MLTVLMPAYFNINGYVEKVGFLVKDEKENTFILNDEEILLKRRQFELIEQPIYDSVYTALEVKGKVVLFPENLSEFVALRKLLYVNRYNERLLDLSKLINDRPYIKENSTKAYVNALVDSFGYKDLFENMTVEILDSKFENYSLQHKIRYLGNNVQWVNSVVLSSIENGVTTFTTN